MTVLNNTMKSAILNIFGKFYKFIFRPVMFLTDPEKAHDRAIELGKFFSKNTILKNFLSYFLVYENKALEQIIKGIKFKNPVGLAAGFDKNAELTEISGSLGFGFEEIGSITGEPCEGNPKPRLWRMPKSKGLVVWYGLKNNGCKAVYKRLKNLKFEIPIGVNVAKTNSKKCAETEEGIKDYVKAFSRLLDIGDYFTINISCPNAFGGEPFTDPKKFEKLLSALEKYPTQKPIFIKLPPDLNNSQIDSLVEICKNRRVDGFVIGNLTKKKELMDVDEKEYQKVYKGNGGISGKAVEKLANELIAYVYKNYGDRFLIIGCGGIFSAKDAYKKIRLGASLVQLITGMIFEGPQLIYQINRNLVKLLEKDGFKNISEAVGVDIK